MLVSLVVGSLILVPALYYLYSLFQREPASRLTATSEEPRHRTGRASTGPSDLTADHPYGGGVHAPLAGTLVPVTSSWRMPRRTLRTACPAPSLPAIVGQLSREGM